VQVKGEVRTVITNRRRLHADLVIMSLGIRPNSALAAEAGIPLDQHGGIRVNDRMQTEEPGVWAAGNCVESFYLVSQRPYYIALGTVANKQGRAAGTISREGKLRSRESSERLWSMSSP